MHTNHARLFEHFGKLDGLQDEIFNHHYGLQMMSNKISIGVSRGYGRGNSGSDEEFGYMSNESSGKKRVRFSEPEVPFSDGREYYDGDYDDEYRSGRRGSRSSRSRRGRHHEREGYLGGESSDDYFSGSGSGSDDSYDGYTSGSSYELLNYHFEDSPIRKTHGRRHRYHPDDYYEDHMHERALRREMRRYYQRRRMPADPIMLPYCKSYYPMGPFGPRIPFCPYVPLMEC